jgi:hypothetical protein
MKGNPMAKKPNPLLSELLNKNIDMPEINWETVPPDINPADAWNMYDETVEGWVPIWFPTFSPGGGRSYEEFERAYLFNENLERILKAMKRWPVWGSPSQKKHAVAVALLHLYCETRGRCPKI